MPPTIDNYPLARRLRQRYIQAPGVIRRSDSSAVPARAAEFAASRLPLLTAVRRRWQSTMAGQDAARPPWVHPRPAARPVTGDTPRSPIVSARHIPPETRNAAGPPAASRLQAKAAGIMQPGSERLKSITGNAAQEPSMAPGFPSAPSQTAAKEASPSPPANRRQPAGPVKAAGRSNQPRATMLQKKALYPVNTKGTQPPHPATSASTEAPIPDLPGGKPGAEAQIMPSTQPAVIVDSQDRMLEVQQSSADRRLPAAPSDRVESVSPASNVAAATPIRRTHDGLAERAAGPKPLARPASAAPARPPESSADPLRIAAPQKPLQIPGRPIIPLHRTPEPLKTGKLTVRHRSDPSRQGRPPSGGVQSQPPVVRQGTPDTARPAAARAKALVQRKTAAPGPAGKAASPERRPESAAGVSAGPTAHERHGMNRSTAAQGDVRIVRQAVESAAALSRRLADRNNFGGPQISWPLRPAAIAPNSGRNAALFHAGHSRSAAGQAASAANHLIRKGSNIPVISSSPGAPLARRAGSRSGSELSVTRAVPPTAADFPATRLTAQPSGGNMPVSRTVGQSAGGPLVSRKTDQRLSGSLWVTGAAVPAATASSRAPLTAASNGQSPSAADRHGPPAGGTVPSAPGTDGRRPTDVAPRQALAAQVMAAPSFPPKPASGSWRFTREFSRRLFLQRDSESRFAPAPPAGGRYALSAMHPAAVSRPGTDRPPPPPVTTRVYLAPAEDRATASSAQPPEPDTASGSAEAELQAPATRAGNEPIDLERLADEVYDIIERRLIVERERSGM